MLRYWMCIIGPVEKEKLPSGADAPLRNAVENAFEKMLGRRDDMCQSGWGLTQKRMLEVQEVWNKEETHQMQNDEHNQLLNNAAARHAATAPGTTKEEHQPIKDAVAAAQAAPEQDPPSSSEQPEPTGPRPAPGPEPPKGAKVIRIWRTEDGKLYLNDANLGPGPTFDLLNWAQLSVQMPFFFREMSAEMMRLASHTMKQLAKTMHDHEVECHGIFKGAHPGDTSANPEEPVDDPKDDSEPLPESLTDKH